jgi:DNA-binding response OmpR family regulator
MTHRVLVVDDDPTVSEVLCRYLEQAGFDVEVVPDGRLGLEAALTRPPDLLVLDLMLPGLHGLEVFRRVREQLPLPVIMLTALGDETDRLTGLELGADDYVTKPFSPRELVLRVQSVLRRNAAPQAPAAAEVLVDGELRVDVPAHDVLLRGAPLALTTREYDLLLHFLRHPRQAFSREQLLKDVWGWEYADQSTVTVHVRRLREKVEDDPQSPRRIVTVFGVGYRYEEQGG